MDHQTEIFDQAASEFDGPFTREEITTKLQEPGSGWHSKKYYVKDCIKTRIKNGTLVEREENLFEYIGNATPQEAKEEKKASSKLSTSPKGISIDPQKAFQFYQITKQQLDQQARDKKIKNLSRYYELTDYRKESVIKKYKGKAQILAQIAFHAQNGTMISSIVKFERNIDFLSGVLYNFDPAKVCDEFPNAPSEKENAIQKMVEKFRTELKWDSSKSKNKDAIMRRYAASLIEAAAFVNQFKSREAFLKSLCDHYKENNYKDLVKYFNNNVKTGFSIALTCDFLKEFDKSFSSLPKPDVHIKDTIRAFFGFDEDYYKTQSKTKDYECIAIMQNLVEQINKKLQPKEQITVYQLDRMIWLVCSGNFFLDNTKGYKDRYLKALAEI